MSTTTYAAQQIGGDPALWETAIRLFEQHCPPSVVREAELGQPAADLWNRADSIGLTGIGSSQDDSGGIQEGVTLLQAVGRYAVPLPFAENGVLGGWIYHQTGLPSPTGPVTVPIPDPRDTVQLSPVTGTGRRLAGRWHNVPWAADSGHLVDILVDADGTEVCVKVTPAEVTIEPAHNLAGEPRQIVEADVVLDADHVEPVPAGTARRLRLRGSLSRAAMMSGAMHSCVSLASAYSKVRHQFGRPIGHFQAVQHLLAVAAENAALANAAVAVAGEYLERDPDDQLRRVAAARAVVHDAHKVVTKNAHQAFGAIGVTQEHELQLRTRRLWSWDTEWNEPQSASAEFGQWLLKQGPVDFWHSLTADRPNWPSINS